MYEKPTIPRKALALADGARDGLLGCRREAASRNSALIFGFRNPRVERQVTGIDLRGCSAPTGCRTTLTIRAPHLPTPKAQLNTHRLLQFPEFQRRVIPQPDDALNRYPSLAFVCLVQCSASCGWRASGFSLSTAACRATPCGRGTPLEADWTIND